MKKSHNDNSSIVNIGSIFASNSICFVNIELIIKNKSKKNDKKNGDSDGEVYKK